MPVLVGVGLAIQHLLLPFALTALMSIAVGCDGDSEPASGRCSTAQADFEAACGGDDLPDNDMVDFFGNCSTYWGDEKCGEIVRGFVECIERSPAATVCSESGPCAAEWSAVEDGLCEDELTKEPREAPDDSEAHEDDASGGEEFCRYEVKFITRWSGGIDNGSWGEDCRSAPCPTGDTSCYSGTCTEMLIRNPRLVSSCD